MYQDGSQSAGLQPCPMYVAMLAARVALLAHISTSMMVIDE